ncbi:hypothetical protein [Desulfopila sp. IMCC35008]|uniref:hypothetical protein n=1 Tax=Desulfopila sp. IMCC35008 TaxID=2653858 RepID=UPI0013D08F11|nr:hypothetical protein [Desulfopila sp. IMCC35008]
MNIYIHLLLVIASIFISQITIAQQAIPPSTDLMVGFYGRPGAVSLGVLGQYSIEDLMPKIKAKANEYAQITGNQKITPAFHIIYGLATYDPGKDNDYITPLSDGKVMQYINAGKASGFAVIIDLQLGKLSPLEAVKPVLPYLKHENVHLAIDPEFEVNNLEVPPGKVIGHISGDEINQIQSAMTKYMTENDIDTTKILIVHMFRKSMVNQPETVKNYDNIDLIMNLDGHGSPQLKVDIYNGLYSKSAAASVAGGFKLFFLEDKPSMMTPKQVLGMENVGKTKIKIPPRYINYQ